MMFQGHDDQGSSQRASSSRLVFDEDLLVGRSELLENLRKKIVPRGAKVEAAGHSDGDPNHRDEKDKAEGIDDVTMSQKTGEIEASAEVKKEEILDCDRIFLLHGKSGTGKSSLCRQLAQETNDDSFIFVTGKFDQYSSGKNNNSSPSSPSSSAPSSHTTTTTTPLLSALVEAMDKLGAIMQQKFTTEEKNLVVQNALTNEGSLLTTVAPNVAALLEESSFSLLQQQQQPEQTETASAKTNSNDSLEDSSLSSQQQQPSATGTANLLMADERLVLAIRTFWKGFDKSLEGKQVVIFLDDIQWADPRSLPYLSAIAHQMQDHQHRHKNARRRNSMIMIWGCRDEATERLDWAQKNLPSKYVDVAVGNLSETECNQFVAKVLQMSPEGTLPLAKIVHRKTLGNPLAIQHFLKLIEQQGMLIYNIKAGLWTWKISEIQSNTEVAPTVVAMLTTRIQTISPHVKRLLKLASCTGFSFEEELLETLHRLPAYDASEEGLVLGESRIAKTMESDDSNHLIEAQAHEIQARQQQEHCPLSFDQILKCAYQEGLIERVSSRNWRFTHDRVQECFHHMLPLGKAREALHYCLGKHFQNEYGKREESRFIFLITEQWNCAASILKEKEADRKELLGWNLKAAKAANRLNATDMVNQFTLRALQVCHDYDWNDMYDTLLQIYNLAAEAAFAAGNFSAVGQYALIVSSKAQSMEDTLFTKVLNMQTLGAQAFFTEAISVARQILDALGEPFPPAGKRSIAKEARMVQNIIKGRDNDFFLTLPMIRNQNIIWAMQILMLVSIYGWNSDRNEASLAYLRLMHLTCTKGTCHVTPMAFAGYAALIASMGEDAMGFRFSELAKRSITHKSQTPSAYIMIHSFGSHLGAPVSTTLEPSLQGYRAGLQYGDIVSGTICMAVYSCAYNFCGLPLHTFVSDARNFAYQLKLLRQEIGLSFVLVFYQMGLHLTGAHDGWTSWESLREDALYVPSVESDPESQSTILMLQARLFEALILNDLHVAEETWSTLQTKKQQRLNVGHFINLLFALSEGIFCAMKQRTSRKYRKQLNQNIAWLKERSKAGNVNTVGILQLILAQQSTTTGEPRRLLYHKAIATLVRSGFTHFGALANELAARCMHENDFWREYYLSQAMELYAEWGALRKVNMMRAEHPFLADESYSGFRRQSSSMIKGRAQFNPLTDDASHRNNNNNNNNTASSSSSGTIHTSNKNGNKPPPIET